MQPTNKGLTKILRNLHFGGETDALANIVNIIHGKSGKERVTRDMNDITKENCH